jgi:signal transduction histidine kinase
MVEPALEGLESAILSEFPVGLWVGRAPSGSAVYANQTFRDIVGMTPNDDVDLATAAGGYRWQDRTGQPYPLDRLPFAQVLAQGRPVVVDDLVVHRTDGRRVYLRAFARPLRSAAGPIKLVVIAFVEITAEVQAISHGRTMQARLLFVLHHAPVLLFAVDRNAVVTMSEGAALTRLGLRSGEAVGRNARTFYGGRYGAEPLDRALAGEQVTLTTDIRGTILVTSLTPVRDDTGAVVEVIGISTDVTEERRLQARLIQDDRLRAMGTMAASVAHEINNPLTYIFGNLEQIEHELSGLESAALDVTVAPAQERQAAVEERLTLIRDMLGAVRIGADRIRRVASDLGTFTRPDDETVMGVDVPSAVRSALALVQKEIQARAELVLTLGPTAPVKGNEARLVQVLLNLLVNAWQALPAPDPARHRIQVATFSAGDWVVIEVSDTGPGVPAHLRPHVFDPFFTTKPIGAGSGLGLFVCRNIVTSFGGEISVDDRPGGGAVFRVQLPTAAEAPASQRPRVLIIEDDERVGAALAVSLRSEFEVMVISDGQRALERMLSDPGLALVYCDLMMSGLTGMGIYERLAEQAPEQLPKVVFMTGGAYTPPAASLIERLDGAVVYKPFDILAETRRRLKRG